MYIFLNGPNRPGIEMIPIKITDKEVILKEVHGENKIEIENTSEVIKMLNTLHPELVEQLTSKG